MEWIERARTFLEGLPADVTTASIAAAILLAFGLVWCRIFARAGHHPAMGFLMLVPLVNVFVFLSLAFSRWPVENELRRVRGMLRQSADSLRRAA